MQIRIQIVGARILLKSISKSMANTRLGSCIFKTMGSKENKLKISWLSGVPSRSYQYLNIAKSKKNLGFCVTNI